MNKKWYRTGWYNKTTNVTGDLDKISEMGVPPEYIKIVSTVGYTAVYYYHTEEIIFPNTIPQP